jgi:hypothetical protein
MTRATFSQSGSAIARIMSSMLELLILLPNGLIVMPFALSEKGSELSLA